MTVQNKEMFEGDHAFRCDYCNKPVTKWIENCPAGMLCINCAHTTMRVLLEDIIEYHNGAHISLLDVMYHGNKDHDKNRLMRGLKPSGQPESVSLFDF